MVSGEGSSSVSASSGSVSPSVRKAKRSERLLATSSRACWVSLRTWWRSVSWAAASLSSMSLTDSRSLDALASSLSSCCPRRRAFFLDDALESGRKSGQSGHELVLPELSDILDLVLSNEAHLKSVSSRQESDPSSMARINVLLLAKSHLASGDPARTELMLRSRTGSVRRAAGMFLAAMSAVGSPVMVAARSTKWWSWRYMSEMAVESP